MDDAVAGRHGCPECEADAADLVIEAFDPEDMGDDIFRCQECGTVSRRTGEVI